MPSTKSRRFETPRCLSHLLEKHFVLDLVENNAPSSVACQCPPGDMTIKIEIASHGTGFSQLKEAHEQGGIDKDAQEAH